MNIGFIAMSGARAYNKELTALGLTLPGFVERGKTIASLPSLGLLTLAGMTPPEIEATYVDVPDLHALARLPGPFDAVAISSFTAQIKDAYRLADRYRAQGTHVILGGLHVSALPHEAAQHADTLVLGEGESVWPAVMADMSRGEPKPLYDARRLPFDLAWAPMPAFHLLDVTRYNRLTVQTERGCPWRCEFCASSIRLSPTFKLKPVDKVLDEIHCIKDIWPHPFIEFADDNTFVNKRWSKTLLRALTREHVRWFTETDISVADDDEMLHLMHDSGCAQVLIGFESPSAKGLDGLEQRTNWKANQRDRYMTSIRRIQDHGITVNGCFILGLDGCGLEAFDGVFEFVEQSGLYEVQITVMTAFPGTPLYDRLKRADRLLDPTAWELCTLFDVNYRPAEIDAPRLEEEFRNLAGRLYSREAVESRRQRYWQRLRTVRHRARTLRRCDYESDMD